MPFRNKGCLRIFVCMPFHPCFWMFCYVQTFLRRVFLVFVANLGQSGLETVTFVGWHNPLRNCIWHQSVKINMVCLQLRRSYKAWKCVWIRVVLFVHSVSRPRHVPMIRFYLFIFLLPKNFMWSLPWGFNCCVSCRT